MKKLFIASTLVCSTLISYGQGVRVNMEVFHVSAALFTIILFMVFIVTILGKFLEFRLKNKIIEKGAPEDLAASILQTRSREERFTYVKWFAILAGLGAALTIIHYTQPLGIHSLAIMAFSLAASFLGYYLFTRRAND